MALVVSACSYAVPHHCHLTTERGDEIVANMRCVLVAENRE